MRVTHIRGVLVSKVVLILKVVLVLKGSIVQYYLPLHLPHVDEVLAQLGPQEPPVVQDGQAPGRGVSPPVGGQAGPGVEVRHRAVPQLGGRVRAYDHFHGR